MKKWTLKIKNFKKSPGLLENFLRKNLNNALFIK